MGIFLRRLLGVARLDVKTYEEIRSDPKASNEALVFLAVFSFVNALFVARSTPELNVPLGLLAFLGSFLGWPIQLWLALQICKHLAPKRKWPSFEQAFRVLTFSFIPLVLVPLGLLPLAWLDRPFRLAGILFAMLLSAWLTLGLWKAVQIAFRYEGGALDAFVKTFIIMGVLVGLVAIVLLLRQ